MEFAPGRLRAAEDVGDVLPAAVGEGVDASSELPRDLVRTQPQAAVSAQQSVQPATPVLRVGGA